MGKPTEAHRSAFSACLSDLLRASGLTQRDIAFALGITSAAISQWLSDSTLPRADVLADLITFLRTLDIPSELWLRFERMADQPAQKVSRNFRSSVLTVRAYTESAQRDHRAVLRTIERATASLEPHDRPAFLRQVGALLEASQAQSVASSTCRIESVARIEEYSVAASTAFPFLNALRLLVSR